MGVFIVITVGLVLVIVGLVVYGVSIYNGLILVKNNIEKSWANIDVLLKQRSDELPKLLASVKGYMQHEKETLEKLTLARTKFLNANSVKDKAAANNLASQALKSVFAVAENYPELKADKSFHQLQTRISGLESDIADRREYYNDSVNSFNIRIESLPDLFIARLMGFQRKEMFKVSEADRQDVEIKF